MGRKKKIDKDKAKKVIPEVKIPEKPLIAFKVYKSLSGIKWDQLAGFQSYVKRNSLGPLTVLQWKEAFQKFMGTPIK